MHKCVEVVVSPYGCGVVLCVGCLPIGFLVGLWSSTCIVTLLRMRGPLVDVWLCVPGLCPLVMSVVSGLAVSYSLSWFAVAFVLPKKQICGRGLAKDEISP